MILKAMLIPRYGKECVCIMKYADMAASTSNGVRECRFCDGFGVGGWSMFIHHNRLTLVNVTGIL